MFLTSHLYFFYQNILAVFDVICGHILALKSAKLKDEASVLLPWWHNATLLFSSTVCLLRECVQQSFFVSDK